MLEKRNGLEVGKLTADGVAPGGVLNAQLDVLAIALGPFDGPGLTLALVLPVLVNEFDDLSLGGPVRGNTSHGGGGKGRNGTGQNDARHVFGLGVFGK